MIEKKFGAPQITKDGVTVAKEIELEDKFENTGAQLVKSVASKTGDDAGDGTTTATILTQAIVTEGLKNVTAGANPMDLKRGIDKAVKAVTDFIAKSAEQVGDNYDKIEQVATVSANNDKEIGELLAEAMRKVSKDGVITIEESKSRDTHIGVVEGMQFDRGYLSGHGHTWTPLGRSWVNMMTIHVADIQKQDGFFSSAGTAYAMLLIPSVSPITLSTPCCGRFTTQKELLRD